MVPLRTKMPSFGNAYDFERRNLVKREKIRLSKGQVRKVGGKSQTDLLVTQERAHSARQLRPATVSHPLLIQQEDFAAQQHRA